MEDGKYSFFILASGTFFLHGFMRLGQSIIHRRYVPVVISSLPVVIPYVFVLYRRLIGAAIIDVSALLICFAISLILVGPFILANAQGWGFPL